MYVSVLIDVYIITYIQCFFFLFNPTCIICLEHSCAWSVLWWIWGFFMFSLRLVNDRTSWSLFLLSWCHTIYIIKIKVSWLLVINPFDRYKCIMPACLVLLNLKSGFRSPWASKVKVVSLSIKCDQVLCECCIHIWCINICMQHSIEQQQQRKETI